MRRRDFIVGIGLAANVRHGFAQEPYTPRIAYLSSGSSETSSWLVDAFKVGLTRYTHEMNNIPIEFFWANGKYDLLPALVEKAIESRPSLFVVGTPVATKALVSKVRDVPIVFVMGSDPVHDGIVASVNVPGQNVTGATFYSNFLTQKRISLFSNLLLGTNRIAVLTNPDNLNSERQSEDAIKAASELGIRLIIFRARSRSEIKQAIISISTDAISGLLILSDAFLDGNSSEIATMAIEHRIATCFAFREPVRRGGLISYGSSPADAAKKAGEYAALILKGANPATLPVQFPDRFELTINSRTARLLDIVISPAVLTLADEVIE